MIVSIARLRASWPFILPVLAWVLIGVSGVATLPWIVLTLVLLGTVLAAVHHAELVAHHVGEPLGTLLLAVAVTVIETALIVSIMLSGGDEAARLPRDTVFAAIMIILNGIVGACLLVGGLQHREQTYGLHGVSAALATLAALAILTLVLPNYTSTSPGPWYSDAQVAFVAFVSLALYGTFVLMQTVRHRADFVEEPAPDENHAVAPSRLALATSTVVLLIALGAVVLLAKRLAPSIEALVASSGAPRAVVGLIIAAVVLMPEGLAALRAAKANRLQTSLNLALGSALAAIALTLPTVAALSLAWGLKLELGLDPKATVLLVLSLFVAQLSLATGRTTLLQGAIHLVIFGVYVFLTLVP